MNKRYIIQYQSSDKMMTLYSIEAEAEAEGEHLTKDAAERWMNRNKDILHEGIYYRIVEVYRK